MINDSNKSCKDWYLKRSMGHMAHLRNKLEKSCHQTSTLIKICNYLPFKEDRPFIWPTLIPLYPRMIIVEIRLVVIRIMLKIKMDIIREPKHSGEKLTLHRVLSFSGSENHGCWCSEFSIFCNNSRWRAFGICQSW